MATKKQIAANRRNSKRCTGPKSPAGKAKSSRNALRHGVYSADPILPGEDRAELDNIRGGLQDLYRPQDAWQQKLIDEMAAVQWRLRRAARFEAQIFADCPDQPLDVRLLQFDRITLIQSRLLRAWMKFAKAQRGACPAPPYGPEAPQIQAARGAPSCANSKELETIKSLRTAPLAMDNNLNAPDPKPAKIAFLNAGLASGPTQIDLPRAGYRSRRKHREAGGL